MKLSEYTSYDALGLAELVANRKVSAEELTNAALQAIEKVNPQINAVIESWNDEKPYTGSALKSQPFAGVPFLIKDLAVDMKGRRNELGSRVAEGFIPQSDSYLMRRFREAGLMTIGRTTTPEMATSTTTEPVLNGPTRNPWDTDRSAGGSSGGSGAAVAAGIVPMAHATDGGGSIRVPAASNGLFGMKLTRGRVSNGPDIDEVWNGLAGHFAISRTVRDSAALLDSIHGGDIGEPYYTAPPERTYLSEVGRDPGKLKIGVVLHPLNGTRTAGVISDTTSLVARLLETLGHNVDEVILDPGVSWESFVHANAQFWTANTAAWLGGVAAGTGRQINESTVEPATLALYNYGRKVTGIDLLGALGVRNQVTRSIGRFFSNYDILLTPTLPELPLPIGVYNQGQETVDGFGWINRVFQHSPFTALFNVTGTPAMSMPLTYDPNSGLPIGLQFAAGFGREDLLFRLAGQLEKALPWIGRKPQVWAGN